MLNRNFLYLLLLTTIVMAGCQTLPPEATTQGVEQNAQQPKQPAATSAPAKSTPQVAKPKQQAPAVSDERSSQALQSIKAGDIARAIEQFEQIVRTDPSTPHAYTNLGLLYLHNDNQKMARQAFERAIVLDPQDAVALNNLAIVERHNGEFKKALFNYYKAIKIKPDYANAHLNLGILLDLYIQDLPKALEQYEIYQQLTANKDEKVKKWIIDIKRRIADQAGNKK